MSRIAVAVLLSVVNCCAIAMGGVVTVPDGITSTGGFNPALNDGNRTYQMQFGASYLGGISVGDKITGISFRIASNSQEPDSPASSFTNWDLTLAQAANSVSTMSTTFANNMSDPELVRSGALSFAAGAFQGGAVNPNTNPFGPVIAFSTPYTYRGGDLVVLISHTAGTSTVGFLDSLNSSSPAYGSGYRALRTSAYGATTATTSDATLTITQFTIESGSPVVPEPSMMVIASVLGIGGYVGKRRMKK
jgi:hypothetical protein